VKLGAENRTKVIAAAALGLVAVISVGRMFWPSEPAPAATPTATQLSSANGPRPVQRKSGGKSVRHFEPRLDPTLDLDLLRQSEQIKYAGTGRNIFVAGSEPVIPKPIKPGIAEANKPPQPVIQPPPPIPLKFYGFANGTFYVSANGGANFTAAATGLPSNSKFKAVPGIEGDIWLAGAEGGLWRSTNSGASFTRVTSVEEANTIGFGMAAPGQSYMALYSSAQVNGVRGIFRSTDAGATWVRVNDDQHQYGSTDAAITGDPRVFGRVYISTNGRGVIYGEPSGVSNPDFSVSPNPSSLTVNRGASGTSTITIAPAGGFASSVAFSAGGLPSGVTASFNPTSTSGTSSVLTLTASGTATLGAATVTVTGTGGGLTHTTSINLTVNDSGGGTGGVTVTPVINSNGPWFDEQAISLSNPTGVITSLSVTIVVQRTAGVSFNGQYNTVGSQILQSNTSTATTITYQFNLAAGQTLGTGTNRLFAAQMSGSGTVHPTSGDTYTVTYTTGGVSFTQTGHF